MKIMLILSSFLLVFGINLPAFADEGGSTFYVRSDCQPSSKFMELPENVTADECHHISQQWGLKNFRIASVKNGSCVNSPANQKLWGFEAICKEITQK